MSENRIRSRLIRSGAIEELRLVRGLSINKLAEVAGVSVNTVKKAIDGKEELLLSRIRKIAKALNVEPDTLLDGYQPSQVIERALPQDFEFMVRFRGSIPAGIDAEDHLYKVQKKICCCLEESGAVLQSKEIGIRIHNQAYTIEQEIELAQAHFIHVVVHAITTDHDYLVIAAVIDVCAVKTVIYAHEKKVLNLYEDFSWKTDTHPDGGAFGLILSSHMISSNILEATRALDLDHAHHFDRMLPPGKHVLEITRICWEIRYSFWDKHIEECIKKKFHMYD